MICSGLNRFPLAIAGSFVPGQSSQSTRSKKSQSGQYIRLGSPIPGTPLNYFAGLTQLRLRVFSCATLIGITPPVVLYVWLGRAGRTVLDGSGPNIGPVQAILLGVGIVTTVTATVVVSR